MGKHIAIIGAGAVGAGAGAPVDMDRALAFLGNGVFDQRLDRREARARSDEDDGLGRVLAQEKGAQGPLEAQDVPLLHGAEHVLGEERADVVRAGEPGRAGRHDPAFNAAR